MRLLLCCESYPPSRGGVQEVMRQLAERFVVMGHDVTVATSWHPKRKSTVVNGVKIRDFRAGGKLAHALNGEIEQYRKFVECFDGDAILIMAAQQWSFDALWPVLDKVRPRKVFIPCGFSCLYELEFVEYFKQLPDILRKFDHLIFNAERYRDIEFVRALGLTNFTILPNGVSELEFEQQRDPRFRSRLGISDDDFVFLTVGNPIDAKGHPEVVEAFVRLDTGGRSTTLICNADWSRGSLFGARFAPWLARIVHRLAEIVRLEGWGGVKQLFARKWHGLHRRLGSTAAQNQFLETVEKKAERANAQPGKRVLLIDLPRPDLIQAYMTADLFVFASKVEYSPLVLFEAAAAWTPFLTVPVGNAEEIIRWTGAGMLCDAAKDDRGYTFVDPQVLALEMSRCMKDQAMLKRLGARARERWRSFTWSVIVRHYEAILAGKTPDICTANQPDH